MAAMTYYVVLAFRRSEENGDIVAGDPKEARSADQAIRMAGSLAVAEGHCGAIVFSRTGDPALGDFEDAVILKTVREVDIGLLSTWRRLDCSVLPLRVQLLLEPLNSLLPLRLLVLRSR
jgi:hypothetical protein